MTAPRLALTIAVAASAILLAGCVPTPTSPDPDPTTTAAPEPEVVSLSELEFPFDATDFIAALATGKQDLLDWQEEYFADCDAAQAATADSPCVEGILTGVQQVNAIKTTFDFSPFDTDSTQNSGASGVEALNPTRQAIQDASDLGSTTLDRCYYFPGGETCEQDVQALFDEIDEAAEAMAAWEA